MGSRADQGSVAATADDAHPWIIQDGYFRVVTAMDQGCRMLAEPSLHADLAGLIGGVSGPSGPTWDAATHSLLSLNGDEHRRYRALVSAAFTPRAVERSRPAVARSADSLADSLGPGEVDFLSDFASPYVALGTCGHIGIDMADYEPLSWAVEQMGYASKDLGDRIDLVDEGMEVLRSYAHRAISGEVQVPPGSALDMLRSAVADGYMPTRVAEVLIGAMLSAGNEPTANQLGLSVVVLAERPELWDAIADGTAPIARTVEELLRYRSTNQTVHRSVAEQFTVDDVEFQKGEQVFIGLARCNHDPNRFANPDDVDPELNTGSHLAFGFGSHYCLGASLARVQVQEGLRALTERFRCPTIVSCQESEGSGLLAHTELILAFEART